MKKLVIISAVIMLCCLVIPILPLSGEGRVYTDTIRIHVLANSDSDEDQADKLAVRDAILSYVTGELDGVESVGEASGEIGSLLGEVEEIAKKALAARGTTLPVRAEFGREEYPEREYGEYSLPAGTYVSLRVVIGGGDGHNWWCVLFPSFCTGAAQKSDFIEAGLTSEGYRMIKDTEKPRYKVRFRLLEILSDIFGGDY